MLADGCVGKTFRSYKKMKEFCVDPSCWSFILKKTYFSSMVPMGMSTNDFLSICTVSLSLDRCWRHSAVFTYFW